MPMLMMLSREVRRVPLDFEHPRNSRGLQPIFNAFYVPTVRDWLKRRDAWMMGERPEWFTEREGKPYTFEEYEDNGPDPDYYYPGESWPEGAELGICMYESVTEGTPISRIYPDTELGRHEMAVELAGGSGSITDGMTASDWRAVIDGKIMARDIHTGELS